MVEKTITIDIPEKYHCREIFCNDVYHLKPLHVRVTLDGDGKLKLFIVQNNHIELDTTILQLKI